jgi:hypothetical protein
MILSVLLLLLLLLLLSAPFWGNDSRDGEDWRRHPRWP